MSRNLLRKRVDTVDDLTWKDAIVEVLRANETAMHYTAIAEQIEEQGLRTKMGATPASTVNVTINNSIKSDLDDSPFIKVAMGEYFLREAALPEVQQEQVVHEHAWEDTEAEDDLSIMRAFGMFWIRDRIAWRAKPSLLGRQQLGADAVDFSGQRGAYILYDSRDPIYVGRSLDRALGQRLYEHTQDRLRSRWDRFSWFGILKVTESGELEANDSKPKPEQWIATMESLLIEALEPPQNRKRGDGFSAIEYMQAEDPAIERQGMLAMLQEMEKRINSSYQ